MILSFNNNVCLFQQTHTRITDWIYKKGRFSERTSRGRETGQWQYSLLSRLWPFSIFCTGCVTGTLIFMAVFTIVVHSLYFVLVICTVHRRYLKTWNNQFFFRLSFMGLLSFLKRWSLISCVFCSRSQSSTTEKALANQFLAPGRTPTIASERMPASKTVHMQTKARCTGEMRDELLGTVGWDLHCWVSVALLVPSPAGSSFTVGLLFKSWTFSLLS